MNADVLRKLSRRLERETGYDSISTIERVYDRTDSGAYRCAFSREMTYGHEDCELVRYNPVAMWRHIHFGKHGRSFGTSFEQMLQTAVQNGRGPA